MRVRTTAALLGLGLLLAGCGGEAERGSAPRTTVTGPAPAPSDPPGTVSASTTGAPGAGPSGWAAGGPEQIRPVDPAPFRMTEGPERDVAFTTPSGNIFCRLGDEDHTAGCQAKDAPVPAGAEKGCAGNEIYPASSLGRGFHILGNRIQPSCFSQGVYVSQDRVVLPYGTSVSDHGITCVSRVTGVTCRTRSGSGFVLSKEEARAF